MVAMPSTDDDAWIRDRIARAQAGDREAFGDLVERYQGGLRGFLGWCGVPPTEQAELAQDIFITAFTDLHRFDAAQDFGPWLRGIARHRVLQQRDRYHRRNRLLPLEAVADRLTQAGSELPDVPWLEHLGRLRHCVQRLKGRSAELIRLRYEQGLGIAAIAQRTAQAPAAVRMALSRVRSALRRCIERQLLAEDEVGA